jgi:hypothetical protein
MANSTSKKTAAARAKAKITKPVAKKTSRKKQPTKRSRTQASETLPSNSPTSTRLSIFDEGEELTLTDSVLNIDSTSNMETSDGEEGKIGTAENPVEMSDWEEDSDEELGETLSKHKTGKRNLQ